jgi:hypothetical protein
MTTAQSVRSPGLARARAAVRAPQPAVALTGALMLVLLYAAFDHGGGSVAAAARIQLAVAAIATAATAGLVWSGTLRFAAPRRALIGVGLLAAFAVWSGITLAWSIAPNQTWIELNRAITYVIVLALGVTVGASHARSLEFATKGFLAVTLAVALYGIGQKVVPELHVAGVFNLDQTGLFPRLSEPFGYWNALGLFVAMGVPLALAIVVDKSATRRLRLLALLGLELLLLTLTLTESRGALLALLIALAVAIGFSGARLRSLMWLGVALIASLPPIVMAMVDHNLTTLFVSLSTRERVGAELGALLVASLVALWLAGSRVIVVEGRTVFSPDRARRVGHLAVLVAGVIVICLVIALSLSSRGLPGTISHEWNSFTATHSTSVYAPDRLLSVDSENRVVWWKEALGAFSDRPLTGWGAGSFGVLHLLYRRDTLNVTEAHEVPLQLLAETGLIGALLAIGAYGLLLASGVAAVRRKRVAGERVLAAGLLAAPVAYGIHSLYDWDWDIPGVTFPALVLLGMLVGAAARRSRRPSVVVLPPPGPGLRALSLGAATATLCAYAISGAVPSLAAGRASDALVTAGKGTPAALRSAQSSAQDATSLDPLSDAGLLVAAAIEAQRHDLRAAERDLVQAIGRDPTDRQAWEQLVLVEGYLRNVKGAIAAAERILALDPYSKSARDLAERTSILTAPPQASATAIRTPGG